MKTKLLSVCAIMVMVVGCGQNQGTSSETKYSIRVGVDEVYGVQNRNIQTLAVRSTYQRPAVVMLGMIARRTNNGHALTPIYLGSLAKKFSPENTQTREVFSYVNGDTTDDSKAIQSLKEFQGRSDVTADEICQAMELEQNGTCD